MVLMSQNDIGAKLLPPPTTQFGLISRTTHSRETPQSRDKWVIKVRKSMKIKEQKGEKESGANDGKEIDKVIKT